MPGLRTVNQSSESKREVKCGICEFKSRRDNLKARHFPKFHPGEKYRERGDNHLLQNYFTAKKDEAACKNNEFHDTFENFVDIDREPEVQPYKIDSQDTPSTSTSGDIITNKLNSIENNCLI